MELDYKEIGRNIRKYRKQKDMTQRQLAEEVNLSDQHISHIETGSGKLSLPTLIALANVFDVDPNTLLGTSFTGARDTVLQQNLASLVAGLTGKKLKLCVELCRFIADYSDDIS